MAMAKLANGKDSKLSNGSIGSKSSTIGDLDVNSIVRGRGEEPSGALLSSRAVVGPGALWGEDGVESEWSCSE